MSISRGRLYTFLSILCLIGYLWVGLQFFEERGDQQGQFEVCIVKHITSVPCPACGSTRSVIELIKGDIGHALWLNPFGIIILLIMIITPFWLLSDVILGKSSLYKVFMKVEFLLKRPSIYIPLIAIVVANWIWNIHKGV